MATMSPQIEALAEAHRVAQLRNAVAAAWLIRRNFKAQTAGGSIPKGLLAEIVTEILRWRSKSGVLAATYGRNLRIRMIGGAPQLFTPKVDVPLEKLRVSMLDVGFRPAERLIRQIGVTDDATVQRALTSKLNHLDAKVGAAAMRHVADGGRETIKDIAKNQDKQALGYVRITRPGCCYFCAMLASRGPVYDEGSFGESNEWFDGDGPAKVHDSCNCSLALVYTDEAWPSRSEKLAELWEPGMTLQEWRKFYDAQVRDTLA